MSTVSGLLNTIIPSGNGFNVGGNTTPTSPTGGVDAGVSSSTGSQPIYLGFLPLSSATGSLGLRMPTNAGDSSALIGEIALLLEKAFDKARSNEAANRASAQKGSITEAISQVIEMERLATQIAADEATRTQKETRKGEAQTERTTKNADRAQKIADRDNYNSAITTLNTNITALNTYIATLPDGSSKDIAIGIRDQMITARDNNIAVRDGLNAQIGTLNTQIAALDAEISQLTSDIANLTASIDANRGFYFSISMTLLDLFLFIATNIRTDESNEMDEEDDLDNKAENRFTEVFANNTDLDKFLAKLALELDIRMDKDSDVALNRSVLLAALSLASGFITAVAALRMLSALEANIEEAALLNGGRFKLNI